MEQTLCFIIILLSFHFSEVHLLGPMNHRIMSGVLFGSTVIKEMVVFFHMVVVTVN